MRVAAARADFCRFLAACYYEPGPELAEERLFASMEEAAARIDVGLAAQARSLGVAFVEQTPHDLLVDYTRLFLGPVQAAAPPYGSVWLAPGEGLMRDSTVALSQLYAEAGFDVAEDFHDLPDHVAAELEFLYVLLFREAQGVAGNGSAQPAAAADLKRRFLAAHLPCWVPAFCDAIRGAAHSEFYRRLADVTETFVAMEARREGLRSGA